MDYQAAAGAFKTAMGNIGDALREMLGTTKQYKLTEVADAIREGTQVFYLGTGTSFNIKTLLPDVDYTTLTSSNFIVCQSILNGSGYQGDSFTPNSDGNYNAGSYLSVGGSTPSYSYNATSGVLSVTVAKAAVKCDAWIAPDGSSWARAGRSGSVTQSAPKVFLVIGQIKTL